MAVTPDADATLEQLCEYLEAGLNAIQPGCVVATRAFDDIPQDPSAYPCLVIHRTESEGESFHDCTGRIRYLMYSQDQRSKRPGLFRWIELAIARLLKQQIHQPDLLMKITNLDTLRSRYRIGSGQALFPFLEIDFNFVDWDTEI